MVGVPGRSKGCITCRKRKKGCDKKAPFCGQCLALGIACEGYDRQQIWLNSQGSKQTIYSHSSKSSSPEYESSSRGSPSGVVLHDSLVRTARAQKFTGLFWSDYLSGGNGFSLKASGTTGPQWMRLYENLSEIEPTLQYVAMALSTATLGANNNDTQLKRKSQQAYGLALQQMVTSLESQSRNQDGILAAIQLMRIYEQLFGTDSTKDHTNSRVSQVKGFSRHIDGETALILTRGPSDAWSSTGRQLLADGRLTLINAYTSRRKRSPFSRGQWKRSQLWRSVSDSPLNKLINILVEVPGLLEDLDKFRQASSTEEAIELHSALVSKCRACEIELITWEVEVGDILTIYDYTLAGEPLPLPRDDDDLAVIYLSCYHWMTCLMVYSTIGFCELEDPGTKRKVSLIDCPSQQVATSYAYRIAHAVHLLFQPPAGDYSSVAVFFPFGNALRYLIMTETYGGQMAMSSERLLLVEIFTRPFMGSFVGRFLGNLQADDGIDYGYPIGWLLGMRGVEYRARVWWCGRQAAGLPEITTVDPCRPRE
ncbi:hypothetical protein BKA59DRAFT_314896 [Fusarium tricinctum]|uniref:Zn(2)-C6 fungal-type domain-containing protein n=1 Tax=Fusarium tricinctum TaxID=61284 RepID=A0A8K0W5L1_9HYPO|nr:hypothetical protein BKA59DRAFT_314896 [Fusarium tricinctum]